MGDHIYVAILCIFGGLWHIFTNPWPWTRRCLICSGEAYRDQRLGASVAKAQAPTSLISKLPDAFHHRTRSCWAAMAIRAGCSICHPEQLFLDSNGPRRLPASEAGWDLDQGLHGAPRGYRYRSDRRCLSGLSRCYFGPSVDAYPPARLLNLWTWLRDRDRTTFRDEQKWGHPGPVPLLRLILTETAKPVIAIGCKGGVRVRVTNDAVALSSTSEI